MATVLSVLVPSHSDYNSLVYNSTCGHLRDHSERMWCVKWAPDDRLVEWGREGGKNTGFSCVWARVNRDSAPTLFRILFHCTAFRLRNCNIWRDGTRQKCDTLVIGLCCRCCFNDGAKQGYSSTSSYGSFRV